MLPEIKKILYCTQLGPNTSYVFRYACSLARAYGATITVLHVVETLTPRQRAMVEGYSGEGRLKSLVEQAEQEAVKRIPQRIEEFYRKDVGHDHWSEVVSEILVAEGRVGPQVLAHIDSTGADLVVVGAHHGGGLIDNLIGSTTRTLIKHSPVPVLSVQVPAGVQELTLNS